MSEPIYKLDFSQFNAGIEQYKKLCKSEYAPDGVRKALEQLLLDANQKPPKTPYKWGALRGSGIIEKVEKVGDIVIGIVSFGEGETGGEAPYAARWHEAEPGTINFTEPGAGPKYLESKMATYMEDYLKIIANIIKEKTGG